MKKMTWISRFLFLVLLFCPSCFREVRIELLPPKEEKAESVPEKLNESYVVVVK